MKISKTEDALRKAIYKYGEDSQIDKTIEEMSELMKALIKNRWKGIWKNGKEAGANFVEEIADVELMLRQLKIIFNCHDKVNEYKKDKIERLITEFSPEIKPK